MYNFQKVPLNDAQSHTADCMRSEFISVIAAEINWKRRVLRVFSSIVHSWPWWTGRGTVGVWTCARTSRLTASGCHLLVSRSIEHSYPLSRTPRCNPIIHTKIRLHSLTRNVVRKTNQSGQKNKASF